MSFVPLWFSLDRHRRQKDALVADGWPGKRAPRDEADFGELSRGASSVEPRGWGSPGFFGSGAWAVAGLHRAVAVLPQARERTSNAFSISGVSFLAHDTSQAKTTEAENYRCDESGRCGSQLG